MIIDEIKEMIKLGKKILILGTDDKKNEEIYNQVLGILQENEQMADEYVKSKIEVLLSDTGKKFVNYFEKNNHYPYLTLLKTKENLPENYKDMNIEEYFDKEFKGNKDFSNAFLKYNCIYLLSDNYRYLINLN